ncbi:hypothetical protein LMG23992_02993 [Cupriavidus laharis]|uniref:Class I SAM-dependent methyltransferase n=2 Tax=Cupriavidus laharis TaxID=151654 RepID=A0ABN7YTA6_9BURK|nr:hypothetical protein LMG23992_02993 [Cupriavidus laharis]
MLTLTGAELALEYQWHYLVYAEGDSTEQELRAFHALEPRRDGVYLNYGAGSWSRTLKILRGEGWNVYGFEPHGDASPAGSEVISKRETLAGMRFDGIFSNNVLEHLRHPADELRAMSNLLNAGARMVHATPCFEYLYEYTRFHLFFYLGRSREMLGQQAGLTLDQFIKDDEFMACVWRKSTQ